MTALTLHPPGVDRRPATGILLSHYQAQMILRAHGEGAATVRTSIDLNLTMVIARLDRRGVHLPDGRTIRWEFIETAAESENAVYYVEDRWMDKVQTYSTITDRVYTLYATPAAPTMLVSGVPMHRIKGTNPQQDTLAKIRAVAPIAGDVLDTCTGLGYTACQAARSARRVVTIELDPAAHQIARRNPWSRELFDSPRIEPVLADAAELVPALPAETFDIIIHDPPQLSLAGDLYSGRFYAALHRVLRPRGRLYHYIGDPASRSGASTTRSVTRRLQDAGFEVKPAPAAFGVVARK